jgi:fucose permease
LVDFIHTFTSCPGRRKTSHIHLFYNSHRVMLYLYHMLLPVMVSDDPSSLELIVWFSPSLIGDALGVSIIGVLLGPIYPIVTNEASRILPRWLLTGAIGWIAGFGQAGSAILPFMTGALASKVGIKSLQPLWVLPLTFSRFPFDA